LKLTFKPRFKGNELSLNLFSKSVHFMLKIYTIMKNVKEYQITKGHLRISTNKLKNILLGVVEKDLFSYKPKNNN